MKCLRVYMRLQVPFYVHYLLQRFIHVPVYKTLIAYGCYSYVLHICHCMIIIMKTYSTVVFLISLPQNVFEMFILVVFITIV